MAENLAESAELGPGDIVFDCPRCGKSLAIDFRGAGLTVRCTDCGSEVPVPIPAGMEIADVDATDEDREALLIRLRQMLAAAEERIIALERQLDAARSHHGGREQMDADDQVRIGQVRERAESAACQMREFCDFLDGMLQEPLPGAKPD
jgi:transcription elongation factor Elf1